MALGVTLNTNVADLRRVKQQLRSLEKFSKDELELSLTHFTSQTGAKIKQKAPVDTGRLRREVVGEVVQRNIANFTSIAIDPQTGEDYAPLQEHYVPVFFSTIRQGIRKLVEDLARKLKLIAEQR